MTIDIFPATEATDTPLRCDVIPIKLKTMMNKKLKIIAPINQGLLGVSVTVISPEYDKIPTLNAVK